MCCLKKFFILLLSVNGTLCLFDEMPRHLAYYDDKTPVTFNFSVTLYRKFNHFHLTFFYMLNDRYHEIVLNSSLVTLIKRRPFYHVSMKFPPQHFEFRSLTNTRIIVAVLRFIQCPKYFSSLSDELDNRIIVYYESFAPRVVCSLRSFNRHEDSSKYVKRILKGKIFIQFLKKDIASGVKSIMCKVNYTDEGWSSPEETSAIRNLVGRHYHLSQKKPILLNEMICSAPVVIANTTAEIFRRGNKLLCTSDHNGENAKVAFLKIYDSDIIVVERDEYELKSCNRETHFLIRCRIKIEFFDGTIKYARSGFYSGFTCLLGEDEDLIRLDKKIEKLYLTFIIETAVVVIFIIFGLILSIKYLYTTRCSTKENE
ncbi:DgyrCDS2725 [Dimorphilus gyrociliatus]|uniref:DgyrCDS2725 n=1 Tax=Dimorphilus gyrociliatus TaxID=2664684 RepID=A0A7I8VD27_9ANNE|nr:DgyrCDS2725 [Dimorphilus gyrociliatus]